MLREIIQGGNNNGHSFSNIMKVLLFIGFLVFIPSFS